MTTRKKFALSGILLAAALTIAATVESPQQVQNAIRALKPTNGREDVGFSTIARGLMDTSGNIARPPTMTGNVTLVPSASPTFTGDVTNTEDSTGGDLGAKSTYTGIVNSSLVAFATMTNGTATAKTKALMDDTPAGEWSAIGGGTADPTPANSAVHARKGTNSLKIPFTAPAVAGDGVKFTAFAAEDWDSSESVGFWVYSTIALAAGDVVLKTVDSTGDVSFNFPAVTTANKWTWVEIDISSLTGTAGDAVTNIKVALSTAGALKGAFDLYLDGGWKWDATEELALGVDLVDSPGAVRTVLTFQKAASGNADATAIVPTVLTEDTDFFIHRESGNDFLVTITDQSTKSGFALVNHKE